MGTRVHRNATITRDWRSLYRRTDISNTQIWRSRYGTVTCRGKKKSRELLSVSRFRSPFSYYIIFLLCLSASRYILYLTPLCYSFHLLLYDVYTYFSIHETYRNEKYFEHLYMYVHLASNMKWQMSCSSRTYIVWSRVDNFIRRRYSARDIIYVYYYRI